MMVRRSFTLALLCCIAFVVRAQEAIEFKQETLDNGLQVIYAPLHQAPVVHVRVLYHVGSRDEREDRQGFAHMFEHMMFRGSAHVKPEEHMKLVGMVGGYSNAFTSFDQTVYHESLPSNQLQMALWLEADRMSSFKVSENIYKTERQVVAEEWRMGRNRPYGTMIEDFLKTAFSTHSYRWTPIGNMGDLQRAAVSELQDFFNKYYIPNNAVLVVAGDFQQDQASKWVHDYFAWIPRGAEIVRNIPAEPPQVQERDAVSPQRVPLPQVVLGFKTPPYESDDHYALSLLGTVMGGGASSRLEELLVNPQDAPCVDVGSEDMTLQDAGVFFVFARLKQGRNPQEVIAKLKDALAVLREKGVTEAELAKARMQVKMSLLHGRETAEELASQIGDEALFAGDPNRVNTELAKIDKVTPADALAVAQKYLQPQELTELTVMPDPLGKAARAAATQAQQTKDAPVVAATKPIVPRVVDFPKDYPTDPPIAKAAPVPEFKKGVEMPVDGLKTIVMTDNRLPLVNWALTIRRGADSETKNQKGLNAIVAEMLRHGTKEQTYEELNTDLESRGITISVENQGDFTRVSGECTTDQLDHALERTRQVLLEPRWDADEFASVKDQEINNLLTEQETPDKVAAQDLYAALFPGSPQGMFATPKSMQAITLDDVKKFYAEYYKPNDAILVIAGDVTAERGKELAGKLLADWKPAEKLPEVDYTQRPISSAQRIILVDRPGAPGVSIFEGIRAYDLHDPDKFAGSLAGQVLTGSGIDSRLMKYVRAEKGLVYGIFGAFAPGRHSGEFEIETETRPEATAETIEAAMHVINGMRDADVTGAELTESKLRVAGKMVMGMQTIQDQANTRTDGILNGYPIDYYDRYPSKLAEVSAAQVRDVMNKYVKPAGFTIVVVGPAAQIKPQLDKLGTVEVRPMPSLREGNSTSKPSDEMLKPAGG
jgi:zinc protease